jgi:flagellar basal body-associated protein FliL
MTEETYEMVEASEKKGSRTLWIILAVVAVILICCCCVVILAAIIIGLAGYSTSGPVFLFNSLLSLL